MAENPWKQQGPSGSCIDPLDMVETAGSGMDTLEAAENPLGHEGPP